MVMPSKGAQMTKVTEIFGDTGEVIERDATAEEIAAQKNLHDEFLANEAIKEGRQAAKDSAIAKLASLGLTEDEAKAIIG
jgi:uncharacterized protein YaaR (DUF327 family)